MTIRTLVQTGYSVDEAIRLDLHERSKKIADALAIAFGGSSQVSYQEIGRAVAGQINNNGLTVHGTLYEICVAVYEATLFEGDGHYPADDPDYNNALPTIVGECCAVLDGYGTDYRKLPNKPYLPPEGGY
jgi:hypothetical protein